MADADVHALKLAFGTTAVTDIIIGGVAGRKIRVLGYRLQAEGTVTAKFTDTLDVQVSQPWSFQAREGCVVNSRAKDDYEFETGLGKGVKLNLNAAINVNYTVKYVEVP